MVDTPTRQTRALGRSRRRVREVAEAADVRRVRNRLLPRSVLGLVALVLAAAVGAAFSGTVLFAYYSYQLNKSNQRVDSFISGFNQRFQTALQTIDNETSNGKTEIAKALAPLLNVQQGATQLTNTLTKAAPSVYFVHTLDQNGAPAVGSAFVVASDNNQSLLVTSFATVSASTKAPAPTIFVRKNNQDIRAQLWTWDPANDLALLIVNQANLPKLNTAPQSPGLRVGDQVYAVSGLGSLGGSIAAGSVADVSANLIQDTAAVGSAGQGGPVVDNNGEVVGIASLAYNPLGFNSSGVYFTVPWGNACSHILRCPGGNVGGVGSQGGSG
ncbi:MAG TPA: serine protease [Acidimicrobiales bacterium]|nr:serine protease [Acidimicrobiales bacterium]